jgi:hypothetical protein
MSLAFFREILALSELNNTDFHALRKYFAAGYIKY